MSQNGIQQTSNIPPAGFQPQNDATTESTF